MFDIKEQEIINEAPWKIPLSKRIQKIYEAKKVGLKIVVYLYEMPDTSTFRYRVYNMCQILELSLYWRGTYLFRNELKELYKIIQKVDLVVAVRFRWNSELQDLLDFIHRKGLKAAFDIDDLVYDPKYIPVIMNSLSVFEDQDRMDYWFSYVGRMALAMAACDCLITTNQCLADTMKEDLQKEAYIAKNCLNRMQLEVSEDYYRQKKGRKSIGPFIIGYFSGSPTHINDFRTAAPELKSILEEHPDIILRIVGFLELPGIMKSLERSGRIEFLPLVSFAKLQKMIAEVDVNIVPLADSRFTDCKSELKYFEASVVGTITCASPAYAYQNIIESGTDGYLCRPGRWLDTLRILYENREKHEDGMCARARRKCMENYAYYNLVAELDKSLDDMSGGNR